MMQRSLCFSAGAKGWQVLSASLVFGERGRRCRLWNLLLQDVVDAEGLHGLVEICCRLLNTWKLLSFWKSPSSMENGRAASWDTGVLDSHTEGPSRSAMAPYGLVFKYLVQLQATRTVSCFSV